MATRACVPEWSTLTGTIRATELFKASSLVCEGTYPQTRVPWFLKIDVHLAWRICKLHGALEVRLLKQNR